MRVLIVNKFARVTGGADQHCLELTDELRRLGHEVRWLSTSDAGNLETTGRFVPCHVTHQNRAALSRREQALVARDAMWNGAAVRAMETLLDEFRPNVVHAHKLYPQLSVAPLVLAHRRGVPVVQTLHDYEMISASAINHSRANVDRTEDKLAYRLLNTLTFPVRRTLHRKSITRFISISTYVAEQHARHGIRSAVIPNAVEPLPGTDVPLQGRTAVVFAGRLDPNKGVEDLLECARLLPHRQFVVAGAGALASTVETAARQSPNVRYLGWIDHAELAEVVRHAIVLLVPSRWQEPGGLVALSAISVGTPVIAYDRGGLAETVRETGGGVVVPPNPTALASACESLCANSQRWQHLSDLGRASITKGTRSRRDWARRTLTIYQEAIEDSLGTNRHCSDRPASAPSVQLRTKAGESARNDRSRVPLRTHGDKIRSPKPSWLQTAGAVSAIFLPWPAKRFLYRRVLGYQVDQSARVGFSLILARNVTLARDSVVLHFNVIKNLESLVLEESARVGNFNWITACPSVNTVHFQDIQRTTALWLGRHASITHRHIIDCTTRIGIGAYATVAGYRSQLLTHSIDLKTSRQSCAPISIGEYSFIGTAAVILPGAILPPFSVLGAHSMLRTAYSQHHMLYSGIPAIPLRSMANDLPYFVRSNGYVA